MISLSNVNQALPRGIRSIAKKTMPTAWVERVRARVVFEDRTRRITDSLDRKKLFDLLDAIAAGPDVSDPRNGGFAGLEVIRPDAPLPSPEIEINDSCNINCLMCDTASAKRQKGLMDIELFDETLAQLSDAGTKDVTLHTIGDPLANRNLAKYLDRLRKYKMRVGALSSNFLLMDRHVDTIFEYRDVIEMVRPSIDGCTRATYERIRAGGKFDDLLKNLMEFTDRNRAESNPYLVMVNCAVSRDNFHEIAFFPHIFDFVAGPECFHFGFINSLAPNSSYFFSTRMLENFYLKNRPCQQLWNAPHILKDGSLTSCCRDYNGDLVFGHLKSSQSISESYNNQKIQDLRKSHLDESVEMPELCRECYAMDERVSAIFDGIIKLDYLEGRKAPVRLQLMLNEFARALEKGDFEGAKRIVRSH